MASPEPNPECCVCLESDVVLCHIAPDLHACMDCIDDSIIPMFHAALEQEGKYPVAFGSVHLNALDFVDWLGQDFVTRFARRREEYECNDRIYCPHVIQAHAKPPIGEITNELLALDDEKKAYFASQGVELSPCGGFVEQRTQQSGLVACARCLGHACSACGNAFWGDFSDHACTVHVQQDPLSDLVHGKDFQKCPNCSRVYELLSGCNHCHCNNCRCEFCYICQAIVGEKSGHWNIGSACPRWNQPDDTNAQFDDPDAQFDDDEPPPPPETRLVRTSDDTHLVFTYLQRFQLETWRRIRYTTDIDQDPFFPEWIEEVPLDVEAVFSVSLEAINFTGLASLNAQAELQTVLRERMSADIASFFAPRSDLLNLIVNHLIIEYDEWTPDRISVPRPWVDLYGSRESLNDDNLGEFPRPEQLHNPDIGDQSEQNDGITFDGEADMDVDDSQNPTMQVLEPRPDSQYPIRFNVELQFVVYLYFKSFEDRGEPLPNLDELLPEDHPVIINFTGDLEQGIAIRAHVEDLIASDDSPQHQEDETRDLLNVLNEQPALLAEIVGIMIREFRIVR